MQRTSVTATSTDGVELHGGVGEHTLTLAPEPRAPATMDAWFRASLMIRLPFPTSSGMPTLLVAKPMPNVSAAGFPRKAASSSSSCLWMGVVPADLGFRVWAR